MSDFHQRLYDIQEIFNGVLDVSRKRLKVILEGVTDTVNNWLSVSLATAIAGEDLTNDVLKTEQRFSGSVVTADTLVKSGAGFLHTLTFSCNDAVPTAGSIIVYDNTAESGTILYSETFDTTPFRGFSVILDVAFSTGLYIGFTTTADINVTPSYR